MNEKLRLYIDELFKNAPKTEQTVELKQEILQNTIDRYNDLIAEGKTPDEAYRISVEGIGDIRPLISSAEDKRPAEAPEPKPKKKSRAGIIILSVLAGIILLIVAFCIVAEALDIGEVGFAVETYKDAESYNIGGGSITETVNSIDLDWIDGEINVSAYDGKEVIISETEVKDEAEKLRYKVYNGRLIIKHRASGWHIGVFKTFKKDLQIKIPYSMAEALNNVNINSVSADINVKDIKARELEIENVSGIVNVTNSIISMADISTVSGNVKLQGEIAALEADSVSGEITVDSSVALNTLEAESTSGDITLIMPNIGFTAEFESINGDFNSDYQTTKRGSKYFSGDGSAEYEIDTTSGDFTIKAK